MAFPGALRKPAWTRVSTSVKAPYLSFRWLSQLRKPPSQPFPIIQTCPSPSCPCAPTPADLDIDRRRPLSGTMPAHNQHVVISTGQRDWPSRIEDGGRRALIGNLPLARHLKSQLGPKGNWHDPYHNVMITNSSFPYAFHGPYGIWLSSVYLFPQFQFISTIPNTPRYANYLARMSLLGPNLAGQAFPAGHVAEPARIRDDFNQMCEEVSEVVVLICGHGGRDQRCGVMGPLLQTEFVRQLCYRGVDTSGCDGRPFPLASNIDHTTVRARVALVSHIGGHAFAGNVIIYVPPSFTVEGRRSPLAGKGIWYGRVEPMHVEGMIEETIFKGRVIADLFRGGIEQGGNIFRL